MKGVVKAGRVLYHEGDVEKSTLYNHKTLLKAGCMRSHWRSDVSFLPTFESCGIPGPSTSDANCMFSIGRSKGDASTRFLS